MESDPLRPGDNPLDDQFGSASDFQPTDDPKEDYSSFLTNIPNRRPPAPPVVVVNETFYDEDTSANIIFEEDDPTKIRGATFIKLVQKLTDPRGLDTNLLYDFLLTYRSFATSFELLDALMLRNQTAREDEQKFVWLRVFNVLKQWIERYWYDFDKDNPELGEKCNLFLEQVVNDPNVDTGSIKVAKGVKEKLDRKLRGEGVQTTAFTNTNVPKSNLKNISGEIYDMDPDEVARQITLIEWDLWSKIEPWECLNLAWTKKDKEERSPNVLTMIERFNYVSGWVASTICTIENQTKRIKAAKKFVSIAESLHKIGNFNGVMEIISGINRGPVYRMKNTIGAITKDKSCNKILELLKDLTDRSKNYANMRSALINANPPLIPYLGMYLTDLTFIEEGNSDTIGEHSLINFFRCRLISNSISSIKQYQQQPYNFTRVEQIIEKLNSCEVHDEDTLYEVSLYVEPRNPNEKPEKPALFGGKRSMQDDELNFDLEFIQGWPFYPRDGPSNLNLDDDGNIVSASFTKMVERLTHKNQPDTASLGPFLCSYRAFASSHDLLNLLVERYVMPEPKDKAANTLESFTNHVRVPIYLRVFNVLKTWVSSHWYDFSSDEELKTKLMEFINGTFMENSTSFARTMLGIIEKLEDGTVRKEVINAPESIDTPSDISIEDMTSLDIDTTELARQLALLTQKYFAEVTPNELILLANQDPENMDIPTIGMFEDFVYIIENWVDNELVACSKKMDTGQVINRFVQIATICASFNCWPVVQSILSSLEKTFVAARKQDWAAVGYQERRFFFETKELLFMEKNVQKKNQTMRDLSPPSVPLLDGFISEIVSVHQVYQKSHFSETLVNFERFKNVGNVLLRFRQMQKYPYSFNPVEKIQAYILMDRDPIEDILEELPEPEEREIEVAPIPTLSTQTPPTTPTQSAQTTQTNTQTGPTITNVTPTNTPTASAPTTTQVVVQDVTLSNASPTQLKSFLSELILRDPEFKQELSVMVKEVMAEELEFLRQEISQITASITFNLHGGTESDSTIESMQAQKALESEFPGNPVRKWTFYDESGTVSGTPENISIHIIKSEGITHLCEVIPSTTSDDLNRILRVGKLYKSQYPGDALSCLLITSNIDEVTTEAATKCKIRVILL